MNAKKLVHFFSLKESFTLEAEKGIFSLESDHVYRFVL